jgi:sec-independent protein translocase protein TatA
MTTIGFSLNSIGLPEMLVVLALGLLLFGKRLPEVGRSLGKGIVEFKRGLKGMADEIEEESSKPTSAKSSPTLPSATQTVPPMPMDSREDVRVSRSDKIDE